MPNFNLTDSSLGLRCIVGHLGRDPVMKFTQSGKRVSDVTVATNFKDKGGNVATTWHTVKAWDDQADALMQLKKGQVAVVIGREASREYNGKTYVDISAWFVGSWIKPPDTSQGKKQQPDLPPPPQTQGAEDIPF